MYEENNFWCMILTIMAAGTIITSFTQKYGFGYTAQNMVKVVRADLYDSIIKKQVAWFDNPENTPGTLTNVLASEVQSLNGVSSESLGTQLEAFFGLILGVVLAFIFSWRTSLVALACVPVMVIGNVIMNKVQMMGSGNQESSESADANKLASDAILNYKTVASLGYDDRILEDYRQLLGV